MCEGRWKVEGGEVERWTGGKACGQDVGEASVDGLSLYQ